MATGDNEFVCTAFAASEPSACDSREGRRRGLMPATTGDLADARRLVSLCPPHTQLARFIPPDVRQRFLERIDKPQKNWKFTAADVSERAHWDAYQKAYADVLTNTSTEWAPWYVIPADHKWFERIAAAAVIVDALVRIDLRYPKATSQQRRELAKARRELLAEG